MVNFTPSFILGVVLLISNYPIGWIGLIWAAYSAKKHKKKSVCFMGIGVYAISWVMWFFGFYLCGKPFAEALLKEYHVPILIFTIFVIAGYIFINKYFAKKRSKINKKRLIDKEN